MRQMYNQLGTPETLKKSVVLPNAGTHIIASDMFNDHLNFVEPLTNYCENVLSFL
jgi:hypothetical protein